MKRLLIAGAFLALAVPAYAQAPNGVMPVPSSTAIEQNYTTQLNQLYQGAFSANLRIQQLLQSSEQLNQQIASLQADNTRLTNEVNSLKNPAPTVPTKAPPVAVPAPPATMAKPAP